MELDKEKFINVVSAYRELYDLQHEHYMNQTIKENIWTEIAVELGISVKVCKERWKSLRDGYNRSLKRQKTKSGDGAIASKPWRYEKQMAFLKPYFQARPMKGGLEKPVTEDDSNSLPTPDENTNSTQASTSSAMFDDIKKRKAGKDVQQRSQVAEVLQTYLASRGHQNAKPHTNSPIHSFFTAMADTVINFPPDVQLKVKNQIYLAVSQAEFDIQNHQPLQSLNLNVSRLENHCFATDTQSLPSRTSSRTRYLSSGSEGGYNLLPPQMPDDYTTQSTAIETHSTSSRAKECETETSQRVLNNPKRQYYITPEGLVVEDIL